MKFLVRRSSGFFYAACAVLGVGIGFAIDTRMNGGSIINVTNVITVLGVSFAAFYVWLSARIVNQKDARAKRATIWLVVVLPPLYVLSSGPLIPLAYYKSRVLVPKEAHKAFEEDGHYQEEIMVVVHGWWPATYAPLKWIAQRSWGAPLRWYWELFPIPDESIPD